MSRYYGEMLLFCSGFMMECCDIIMEHYGFMVQHCGLMVECCDFVLCFRLKFSLKKEILLILLCKKRCHCLLLVTMLWFVDVDLLRFIVIDLQWVIVSIVSNELTSTGRFFPGTKRSVYAIEGGLTSGF